jgi:hypothetical protein
VSVTVQIQTDDRYLGSQWLTLDRVPVEYEGINCVGGFLMVQGVVHTPYESETTPASAVLKCAFHPVDR